MASQRERGQRERVRMEGISSFAQASYSPEHCFAASKAARPDPTRPAFEAVPLARFELGQRERREARGSDSDGAGQSKRRRDGEGKGKGGGRGGGDSID